MNLRRVLAVATKEGREIVRDRLFFALAFLIPSVFMVVLGYGLSLDVENIPFAVVDRDGSALSRDYTYRFIGSRYFDFRGYARDERQLDTLVADGRIRFALVIPQHFERDLLAGRRVSVQTLTDGTFPYRAQVTKGYVTAINQQASREQVLGYLARRGGKTAGQAENLVQPVKLEVRYLYNQEVRSSWSIAPKLIMLVLMIVPSLLTTLGVVREKESGSIYNIYSSTVSRLEFLVGKLVPYVGISAANAVVLWLLAVTLFGVPFKGNLLLFFGVTVLYLVCTTGIGLIVSAFVRTQIAALLVTMILTGVQGVQYSGMMIPVESMSEDGQIMAHLLPAMYYTNVVSATFLKGVGMEVIWRDVLILAGYAAGLFTIGYVLFSKRPRS